MDPVPAESGGVHGDDARGALGDGVEVQQLLLGQPALFGYQLPLKKREHGVAAAETAGADPGKGQKKIPILAHAVSFPPIRRRAPG